MIYAHGTSDEVVLPTTSSIVEIYNRSNCSVGIDFFPAISGGIAYVGSDDGNVYALMLDRFSKVKLLNIDSVWSSPTVSDGVVYVGSNDGNVYALDSLPVL